MRVIELCAGAGGQAVGLEAAGFEHQVLVEIDPTACATLRLNRPDWLVVEADLRKLRLDGHRARGVDLLAGGVPCPPFSVAGKQLGKDDERDLFPEMLRLVEECQPKAIMIENVKGLMQPRFAEYRKAVTDRLAELGYSGLWQMVNAADFLVPQHRERSVLVAFRNTTAGMLCFSWPKPVSDLRDRISVGKALGPLMSERGWPGAADWALRANKPAPTIVGGSKKHGGADLGPTRSREAWKRLGVNGGSLADEAPGPDFAVDGMPKLTLRMAARLQGFDDSWQFCGTKTAQYRQIGNAFPPLVAQAVGMQIRLALALASSSGSTAA